ncbi:MAG: hypothetical protein ACLFPF_09390 [Halanaerobiales bacterium]
MFNRPEQRERRRDPDEYPWRPPEDYYPPDDRYYPGPPRNPGNTNPVGRGISPESIYRCLCPAIEHGIKEAGQTNIRHAMTEVAMVAYLMGMGFNYNTAYSIVDFWEHEGFIEF